MAANLRIVERELARYTGTSVEMIERTHGHLVERGADDAFRSRLDAFAARRGREDQASSVNR